MERLTATTAAPTGVLRWTLIAASGDCNRGMQHQVDDCSEMPVTV
ncbi:hypothetical protein [Streptomyces sp. NPDC007205]